MAALAMAQRVAYERGVAVGAEVGYTIRFENRTCPGTRITFMTDGILVRQIIQNPELAGADVVILDEAHERSLHTDILLALVKDAVRKRRGTLKLVVTSATLNTKLFAGFFGGCPVLQMQGKLFPVEVKYQPIKNASRVKESVRAALRMHLHEEPGDILVFLTGSEECEAATRLCEHKLGELLAAGKEVAGMTIFQLYGALSNEEQACVFEPTPEGARKVVFSTNIAETSLTIPNIGFVIDCGFTKQKQFNPRTGMDELVVVPVSKVQAIQRKGRAGRTQPGKCLRLYSEKFYDELKDFTLPEILRVSLSNVVLSLKSMRIKDVLNFDFMEAPQREALLKALSDLFLLGALHPDGALSELGVEISKFPLDPPYAKALLVAKLFGRTEAMLTLVSLLSSETVWRRVMKFDTAEYESFVAHVHRFLSPSGDHETLLNVYEEWAVAQDFHEFCNSNFLNFRGLRQAEHIRSQLQDILEAIPWPALHRLFSDDPNYLEFRELQARLGSLPEAYQRSLLRRCLAMAFYYSCARLAANESSYILAHPAGTVATLDSFCALSQQNKDAEAVVYTELVKGHSGPLLRNVSVIDWRWVEKYLPRIDSIDTFRLAGVELQRSRQIERPIEESEQAKDQRLRREREEKIASAKERYFARKKIKPS